MSESKKTYQQQILFEESVENAHTITTDEQQQVIVHNDDYQADESMALVAVDEAFEQTLAKQEKPRWLWRILMSLFAVLIVVEGVDYFTVGFIESPITTSIVAAIVFIIAIVAGSVIFREINSLRQLRQQKTIQQQALALLTRDEHSEHDVSAMDALTLCKKMQQSLACDLNEDVANLWQDKISSEHNDQEILQHYSRTVLSQVDQKALNEIAKFSTESVVLIALSPIALLDMLFMLWRNLRMINKISALYGLKLSYWSRIKLIKHVLMNMAYAGASEIIADVSVDMLGADLLGKLSGRLAQGLGAGMLTARLGLHVLRYSRPIPYHPALGQEAPKLAMIRKEIINQVTTLIKNKVK